MISCSRKAGGYTAAGSDQRRAGGGGVDGRGRRARDAGVRVRVARVPGRVRADGDRRARGRARVAERRDLSRGARTQKRKDRDSGLLDIHLRGASA